MAPIIADVGTRLEECCCKAPPTKPHAGRFGVGQIGVDLATAKRSCLGTVVRGRPTKSCIKFEL
eukprot:1800371-Amphidinium_carterae.1